jgi:hypothetical protein
MCFELPTRTALGFRWTWKPIELSSVRRLMLKATQRLHQPGGVVGTHLDQALEAFPAPCNSKLCCKRLKQSVGVVEECFAVLSNYIA